MKITKEQAKFDLKNIGIDFNKDFFELPFHALDLLTEYAKKTGYRKPKSASGSRARYFYQNLLKIK